MAFYAFFRMNYSLYHYYFLALFFTVGSYGLFTKHLGNFIRRDRLFQGMVLGVLCLAILLNGYQSYRFNSQRMKKERPIGAFIKELDDFVREHRKEKDFSFNIIWRAQDQLTAFYVGRPGLTEKKIGLISDFLFLTYLKHNHPKYYLVYTNERGLAYFTDPGLALDFIREHVAPGVQQKFYVH